MKGRRGEPFRVLAESAEGAEEEIWGDALVDASGTYGHRNNLGPGGSPALGERALSGSILTGIPDVAANPGRFLGKTTLVVGSGYSAITFINALRRQAEHEPGGGTRVVWVTRRAPGPSGSLYARTQDDPLPERDALAELANQLVAASAAARGAGVEAEGGTGLVVEHHGGAVLHSLRRDPSTGRLAAVVADSGDSCGGEVTVACDEVVSGVGYRPELGLLGELQVHLCYASEGPMKLAAYLLSTAGGGGGDCLAQVSPGPATLTTPEPRLLVLGMKSYGRGSAFLLKIGNEQCDMAIGLLEGLP